MESGGNRKIVMVTGFFGRTMRAPSPRESLERFILVWKEISALAQQLALV